ncbi:hypothetical protein GCM10023310_32610 [Paenibacillus vulneris]
MPNGEVTFIVYGSRGLFGGFLQEAKIQKGTDLSAKCYRSHVEYGCDVGLRLSLFIS